MDVSEIKAKWAPFCHPLFLDNKLRYKWKTEKIPCKGRWFHPWCRSCMECVVPYVITRCYFKYVRKAVLREAVKHSWQPKGTIINDWEGGRRKSKKKNENALPQEKQLKGLPPGKKLERPSPGKKIIIFLERPFRAKIKLERLLPRKNKFISEFSSGPPPPPIINGPPLKHAEPL